MVIAHCSSISLLIAIIFLHKKHEMFRTFKDKQCQIKKDIRYEINVQLPVFEVKKIV